MIAGFAMLLAVAVVGVVLVRGSGQVNDRFVDTWAAAHTLTLEGETRLMVTRYLRAARRRRMWGMAGGLFVVPVVLTALGVRSRGPLWISIFLGYLVGVFYAELSLVRSVPVGDRTASLVRRELADYLPRGFLVAQRVLGLVVFLGAVGAAVSPYGDRSVNVSRLGGAGLLLAGLLAVAFSIGLERVQRWVVQRPQPFTELALVAADDAIRSQSVHSLAASGLAVLMVLLSAVAWTLAVSDVQFLRWTMVTPAFLGLPVAFGACLSYGHRAWTVRRPSAAGTSGAAQ